jgi:hypothetical protein
VHHQHQPLAAGNTDLNMAVRWLYSSLAAAVCLSDASAVSTLERSRNYCRDPCVIRVHARTTASH